MRDDFTRPFGTDPLELSADDLRDYGQPGSRFGEAMPHIAYQSGFDVKPSRPSTSSAGVLRSAMGYVRRLCQRFF